MPEKLEAVFQISDEVKAALAGRQPVVALESTIIAHGMPYPQNVQTAQAVENIVRENGAVPATIAVVGGIAKVGLSVEDLEIIGSAGNQGGSAAASTTAPTSISATNSVAKVGTRDLPFIIAQKRNGATTVSATMALAALAGIRIFVTGGIGGVHRGFAASLDISSDLTELGRTNVAVVCAGAKSILDLPATLEYLETLGVPVVGFGTGEFPAFYTIHSGCRLEHRVDNPRAVAEAMFLKWDLLGQPGGMVIANPIPAGDSLDEAYISQAIENALEIAHQRGLAGKAVTPFLLAEIERLTGGKSLQANIALVKNNARIGAAIAREYAEIRGF